MTCFQAPDGAPEIGAGVWQVPLLLQAAGRRRAHRFFQIRSAGLRCQLRRRAGKSILCCRCRQV